MNPSKAKRHTAILNLFVFLLSVSAALPARAAFDFLEPAKLTEMVKKQIAKQSFGKDIDVFNGQIFDGVSTAIKYRYQSEPSYMENFYTRYDKYTLNFGVNPAAWVEELGAPFALGFSAGSDIVFARQFKKQIDSVTALPYTPYQLPITAARAVERLKPGDFVSFQTHLNFAVSVGGAIPAYEALTVSGATHAFISGDFLVHIFKINDTKIRLKFIALRGKSAGGDLSANIGGSVLSVTGISFVDGRIRKFVRLDPFTLSANVNFGDLFMIDYVLDLKDPRVAEAYDHIMTTKLKLKASELINPVEGRGKLENDLITDLSEFESLFAQEKGKDENQRLIDRIFKGSSSSETESAGFKFGLNLVRFENGSSYSESRILSVDQNERTQRFLFDTFSQQRNSKFLFQLFDESENINASLLFTANPDYVPERYVALVLSREMKSKTLTKGGLKELRVNLKKVLPDSVYSQIQWKDWDYDLAERVNIYFRHQMYFPFDAFSAVPSIGSAELRKRYRDFLEKIPSPEANPMRPPAFSGNDSPPPVGLDRYADDIAFVADQLALTFDPKQSPDHRYKSFVKLKDNALFLETGAGFLISLLPQDRLEQLISYTMELSGKGGDRLLFKYGSGAEDELYKSLLYIQSVLNNRSIDLRLMKDRGADGSQAR